MEECIWPDAYRNRTLVPGGVKMLCMMAGFSRVSHSTPSTGE